MGHSFHGMLDMSQHSEREAQVVDTVGRRWEGGGSCMIHNIVSRSARLCQSTYVYQDMICDDPKHRCGFCHHRYNVAAQQRRH